MGWRCADPGLGRSTLRRHERECICQHAACCAYLAPEQLAGQVGDFRSNLFSVGVILYQLATAKLPFDGQSVASLKAQMDGEIPNSPSQLNTKIPAGISAPILRVLSRNPKDRYQSASELIKDLENFKKFGVKEELPAISSRRNSVHSGPRNPIPAEFTPTTGRHHGIGQCFTPAVTQSKPRDVAVMSAQDSTVAVAGPTGRISFSACGSGAHPGNRLLRA